MTRSEIVADLKSMIGPLGQTTASTTVSNDALAVWVNDAYMYMCDEISKANPDFFARQATTSLIQNQQEYTLPTDFERAIMVNIKMSGTWRRGIPLDNINSIPIISDTSSGQGYSESAPMYYLFGGKIGFMPIPTASVSGGLKLFYQYTPTELGATESPAFPKKYHYLVKYGAYANFLDQDQEYASADRTRQRFYERVEKMIENLSSYQVDEVKSVQIRDEEIYSGDWNSY